MYSRIKRRAYEIVEPTPEGDRPSHLFDIALITLITLNLLAIALETIAPLGEQASGVFLVFELVSVAIFTVEYLARVWVCTEDRAYAHPVKGRLRFAVQPMVLMDLVAIVPFYIPLLVTFDLRFARSLRMLRVFRLVKITRYSESMSIVGSVLRSRREVLLSTLFVTFVLLFMASVVMYLAEREGAARGLFEHPGRHVVGHGDADHGGLRRPGAGDAARSNPGRRGRTIRHRALRLACGHPGVGVRRRTRVPAEREASAGVPSLRQADRRPRVIRHMTLGALVPSGALCARDFNHDA